ncbi:hypothetical protein M422DRAFT_55592 [Sphaerobolus stellatus SS14]|uniref:Uncharacterized protein n=1 Tax=Sphaerobolus stellatus (strain SS14) TaxID=990650 RepID=A0A0C9ULK7_SPHS4|nr:hypothetical protein M422DRAFT_55592 [Sphaerobolus stellatus SS14]
MAGDADYTTISTEYSYDVIQAVPFLLVSARLSTPLIASLSHSMLTKLESIRRLAILFSNTSNVDPIVAHDNIQRIFAKATKLVQLCLLSFNKGSNLIIPKGSMPNMKSYMGPVALLENIDSERKIRSLHLTQKFSTVAMGVSEFQALALSEKLSVDCKDNIRVLDLIHLPILSEERLKIIARIWPNVEVLVLSRLQKKVTLIRPFIFPFRRLQRLRILPPSMRQIESPLESLNHHPSTSLREIHFISVCTARWQECRWSFYSEPSVELTPMVCQLNPSDELIVLINRTLNSKPVETTPFMF